MDVDAAEEAVPARRGWCPGPAGIPRQRERAGDRHRAGAAQVPAGRRRSLDRGAAPPAPGAAACQARGRLQAPMPGLASGHVCRVGGVPPSRSVELEPYRESGYRRLMQAHGRRRQRRRGARRGTSAAAASSPRSSGPILRARNRSPLTAIPAGAERRAPRKRPEAAGAPRSASAPAQTRSAPLRLAASWLVIAAGALRLVVAGWSARRGDACTGGGGMAGGPGGDRPRRNSTDVEFNAC